MSDMHSVRVNRCFQVLLTVFIENLPRMLKTRHRKRDLEYSGLSAFRLG